MTVTVRYIGTTDPYFETVVTGKPGKWNRGDTGEVPDADAALLVATGLFEVFADRVLPFAFNAAGGIAGARLPSGAVAALGVTGIPVMWGPFTASGVVKGVAGDPGTVLAVFCAASASGNITMRNSATVGGGTPLVGATAVAMSAGQMLVIGPQDCANGIVLDRNSGTGTFYVIGT